MEPSHVINIKGLTRKFGSRVAVDNIDIKLEKGGCLGVLGPNGAGKSTTIKMMLGIVTPTSGKILISGMDISQDAASIKTITGVVPQNDNLDPDLTVLENLITYAAYFGILRSKARSRAIELLKFIALENRKDEIIQHLSGGQRRRLLLARALVNDPKLVILDEPTVGLDPQARKLIWERLQSLRKEGVTMLLTSHYIEEVESLASQVVIIDNGKIIAQGTPVDLIAEYAGKCVIRISRLSENGYDVEEFRRKARECNVETEKDNDSIIMYVRDECPEIDALALGHKRIVKRPATLEDVFLKLTGRTLREN